jgi:hypothetical protein
MVKRNNVVISRLNLEAEDGYTEYMGCNKN